MPSNEEIKFILNLIIILNLFKAAKQPTKYWGLLPAISDKKTKN